MRVSYFKLHTHSIGMMVLRYTMSAHVSAMGSNCDVKIWLQGCLRCGNMHACSKTRLDARM